MAPHPSVRPKTDLNIESLNEREAQMKNFFSKDKLTYLPRLKPLVTVTVCQGKENAQTVRRILGTSFETTVTPWVPARIVVHKSR